MLASDDTRTFTVTFKDPCPTDTIGAVKPAEINPVQITPDTLYDDADTVVFVDPTEGTSVQVNYYVGTKMVYVVAVDHQDSSHSFCPVSTSIPESDNKCKTSSFVDTISDEDGN